MQDFSRDGYEELPRSIVDGYSTMFGETGEQLAFLDPGAPQQVNKTVALPGRHAARRPRLLPWCPVAPVFAEPEQLALAGFPAGTPA